MTGCQSQSGWDHGFSAFGGVELARWLVGDCLGDEYLERTRRCTTRSSSQFFNKLPPSDWIISEGEVRSWVVRRRAAWSASESRRRSSRRT